MLRPFPPVLFSGWGPTMTEMTCLEEHLLLEMFSYGVHPVQRSAALSSTSPLGLHPSTVFQRWINTSSIPSALVPAR